MTFQLDTLGVVILPDTPEHAAWRNRSWHDLSPFTQGYVEALFASLGNKWLEDGPGEMSGPGARTEIVRPGFRHLAPEALALILKDCALAEDYSIAPWGRLYNGNAAGGSCFWQDRQAGKLSSFPAQIPYLNDEGKVCLRA